MPTLLAAFLMLIEPLLILAIILIHSYSLSHPQEDYLYLPVFYVAMLIVRLCNKAIYFSLLIFVKLCYNLLLVDNTLRVFV